MDVSALPQPQVTRPKDSSSNHPVFIVSPLLPGLSAAAALIHHHILIVPQDHVVAVVEEEHGDW